MKSTHSTCILKFGYSRNITHFERCFPVKPKIKHILPVCNDWLPDGLCTYTHCTIQVNAHTYIYIYYNYGHISTLIDLYQLRAYTWYNMQMIRASASHLRLGPSSKPFESACVFQLVSAKCTFLFKLRYTSHRGLGTGPNCWLTMVPPSPQLPGPVCLHPLRPQPLAAPQWCRTRRRRARGRSWTLCGARPIRAIHEIPGLQRHRLHSEALWVRTIENQKT